MTFTWRDGSKGVQTFDGIRHAQFPYKPNDDELLILVVWDGEIDMWFVSDFEELSRFYRMAHGYDLKEMTSIDTKIVRAG